MKLTIIFAPMLIIQIIAGDINNTNGVNDENAIYDHLKTVLPKFSPPKDLLNNSVFVYLDLYQILSVNEQNGYMTVKLWVYFYYYSKSAIWNATENGDLKVLLFPQDTFWTPDVVIMDAIETKYEPFTRQAVRGDIGSIVSWSSAVTVMISCQFDVSLFPYDEQNCVVGFESWILDRDSYVLEVDPDLAATSEVPLSHYREHEEWELIRPVEFFKEDEEDHEEIVTIIKIKRRHVFYSLVFMLPLAILYAFSGFVFLVPVDSGEKISFALTLLLAQTVACGTIAEFLPASSLHVPKIAYFLVITVFQIAANSLLTVLVINIHFMGGKHKMGYKIPCIISHKAMWVLGIQPCEREKAFPGHSTTEKTSIKKTSTALVESDNQVIPRSNKWINVRDNVANQSQEAAKHFTEQNKATNLLDVTRVRKLVEDTVQLESEENMEFLWKYFALVVDRMLFILNVIVTVIIFVNFF